MRLDNFVVNALNLKRSVARDVIKNKKISVNDRIITKNDFKVLETDVIKKDDCILVYKQYIYIMMNKPKGYLSATCDKYQKTIFDLIEGYDKSKLFMVGRLDIDTTGLIIITNDGHLAHKLTSPNKNVNKTYFVKCDKEFECSDIVKFKEGVDIYETVDTIYKCKEATLEICKECNNCGYITITEGKYHQVKKMCKACGKDVLELKRLSMGKLKLDSSLKEGQYRELTSEEENILKESIT